MNKLCTGCEQVMHGEKPSCAPAGQKKGVKKTSSRARACAHGYSPTSPTLLLHNNSLSPTPRAGDAPTRMRTRGRKPKPRGTKPREDFTAWRFKKFGGDIDPIREAVLIAVSDFSKRDPKRDYSLWLAAANRLGLERFCRVLQDVEEMKTECERRKHKIANYASIFQTRLNMVRTALKQKKGGAK